METPYPTAQGFVKTVERCIQERLTAVQETQLLAAAERGRGRGRLHRWRDVFQRSGVGGGGVLYGRVGAE